MFSLLLFPLMLLHGVAASNVFVLKPYLAEAQLFDWGICMSVHFRSRVLLQVPFVEPNKPSLVLPIEEFSEAKVMCISDHLHWDQQGYYMRQCYKGNYTTAPAFITIPAVGPIPLSRPSTSGDFLTESSHQFYVEHTRLEVPYLVHYAPPNIDSPDPDCHPICSTHSASVCLHQSTDTIVASKNGIHVADVIAAETDYYVVCGLPSQFLSCSHLSPAGICFSQPCQVREPKHFSVQKHALVSGPASIQPLVNPLPFCTSHFKTLSEVRACTLGLVHLSSRYDNASFIATPTTTVNRVFALQRPREVKKLWPLVIALIIVVISLALHSTWNRKYLDATLTYPS